MENKIIIIEGAQGVGKTTLTNLLRERIPYSNLLRLSGIADKTKEGQIKIMQHYISLIDFIAAESMLDFNVICDRTFTTEYVYSKIGVTQYDFTQNFNNLLIHAANKILREKIYWILLTSTEEKFNKTLVAHKNKVKHKGIEFVTENSMNQQKVFINCWDNLKEHFPNVFTVSNADKSVEQVYSQVEVLLNGKGA